MGPPREISEREWRHLDIETDKRAKWRQGTNLCFARSHSLLEWPTHFLCNFVFFLLEIRNKTFSKFHKTWNLEVISMQYILFKSWLCLKLEHWMLSKVFSRFSFIQLLPRNPGSRGVSFSACVIISCHCNVFSWGLWVWHHPVKETYVSESWVWFLDLANALFSCVPHRWNLFCFKAKSFCYFLV